MNPKCFYEIWVTNKKLFQNILKIYFSTRSLTTGKGIMKILNNVFVDTKWHKVIQDNIKYEYQILMNIFEIWVFIKIAAYIFKATVLFRKTFFSSSAQYRSKNT